VFAQVLLQELDDMPHRHGVPGTVSPLGFRNLDPYRQRMLLIGGGLTHSGTYAPGPTSIPPTSTHEVRWVEPLVPRRPLVTASEGRAEIPFGRSEAQQTVGTRPPTSGIHSALNPSSAISAAASATRSPNAAESPHGHAGNLHKAPTAAACGRTRRRGARAPRPARTGCRRPREIRRRRAPKAACRCGPGRRPWSRGRCARAAGGRGR